MQRSYSLWPRALRSVPALALLACSAIASCTLQAADQADPPRPLPREIVQAWEQAGASVGWMR